MPLRKLGRSVQAILRLRSRSGWPVALTVTISVVGWTRADATRHFCAVRHGVLAVTGGREISIATREAILGDDLATLDRTVLARFRADIEAERTEHVESTRLQLNAIRQIMRHLRPDSRTGSGNLA